MVQVEKIFVSLGSGCAVSQRLNEAGLRKQSYPFDWLWNLEGGLEVVNDIIGNDFFQFIYRSNLVTENHYRWNKKVIINRFYPNIAHIHSDPQNNEKDYQSLLRRVKKIRDLLNGKSNIQFIYFRSIEEFDPSTKHKEYSLTYCFERLLQESTEFIKIIKNKYPSLQFKLLSICMISNQQAMEDKFLIKNFVKQNYECLDFEIVYTENEIKRYKNIPVNMIAYNSWMKIFLKKNYIGLLNYLFSNAKYLAKCLVQYKLF